MMFWFSAIGLVALVGYLLTVSLYMNELPMLFHYNEDQSRSLVLTGIFSALNLTCLVIAY